MTLCTYVVGDATQPIGTEPRIIVHIVNDIGTWGAGFVLALSKRWKQPKQRYQSWFTCGASSGFRLGRVQFVEVESELWVANLIGQRGIGVVNGVPPIRYEAVREGLQRVAAFAREQNASIHMPRIGAGLAGGDWPTIERIIEEELDGLSVTVYDVPTKP